MIGDYYDKRQQNWRLWVAAYDCIESFLPHSINPTATETLTVPAIDISSYHCTDTTVLNSSSSCPSSVTL